MHRLTWSLTHRAGEEDLCQALYRVGFPNPADYPWADGPGIDRMVRAYQQDCGLVVDGICGPKTWARLDSDFARPAPVAPDTLRPEIARINSLLDPEVWSRCGYYSMTSQNVEKPEYLIRRAGKAQRLLAKMRGYSTTHGLTCGHFGDYLIKLYLGEADPRIRHTGMNLGVYWGARDAIVPGQSSTCGVGLFAGAKVVDAGTWRPRVRGCYPDIIPDDQAIPCELAIVEYGSHVICLLKVAPDSGIIDPRTGQLARVGTYRVGADGSGAKTGQPWTFRQWRESDDAGIRHIWRVRLGVASDTPMQAWLEV